MYAFSENFVLPLSHDEVVHGKCSLISKMPGDYWQKFAGLRVFFGYWIAHPGKKLLFMGGEFGQFIEWNYDEELDWHLVQKYPMHEAMQTYSRSLNKFYCETKALWQVDFDWEGFKWIDCDDNENSVISFIRKAKDSNDFIIVLCNFTPELRENYRVGMPSKGIYVEVFNSDDKGYGGSGVRNVGDLQTEDVPWQGCEQSITLSLPPLAAIFLRVKGQAGAGYIAPEIERVTEVKGRENKEAVKVSTEAARKESGGKKIKSA
jgi:1,4-alpha-glucan branching enzyme